MGSHSVTKGVLPGHPARSVCEVERFRRKEGRCLPIASPACTELEVVMMDWLAKMLKLPQKFLFSPDTPGGGVIHGTASEATHVAILAARNRKIRQLKQSDSTLGDHDIISKLILYCSDQAHSSVERAAMLCCIRLRKLESDADFSLRGGQVTAALEEDRSSGLIPFLVVATLGTTPSCAFDKLEEIGPICEREDVWMHVDAAYAGSAFICDEYRPLLDGVEFAKSFNFNPHKWMMINFDCSAVWFDDSRDVVDAFNVDPLYLKHERQGSRLPDYRHWQIPLGRRFRSLKIWFVLRLYGVEAIREHIRKHCRLAKHFERLLVNDERFELVVPVRLGLVCFRLRGRSNEVNERLLKLINERAEIHLVPSKLRDVYMLRFAIVAVRTEEADVDFAWRAIKSAAEAILAEDALSVE